MGTFFVIFIFCVHNTCGQEPENSDKTEKLAPAVAPAAKLEGNHVVSKEAAPAARESASVCGPLPASDIGHLTAMVGPCDAQAQKGLPPSMLQLALKRQYILQMHLVCDLLKLNLLEQGYFSCAD